MSILNEREKNGLSGWFSLSEREQAYWNHEVAKQLEVGESTLRKWCIELEKNGYTFIKGTKDSRAFTDHDLQALLLFKQLTRVKNHTKEQASIVVVERYLRKGGNDVTTPVHAEENQSLQELKAMVKELLKDSKEQKEFNRVLVKKLEEQDKFIKESIEKRDRLLLENIRSGQEQAAEIEKKKISNKIKRFFGIK